MGYSRNKRECLSPEKHPDYKTNCFIVSFGCQPPGFTLCYLDSVKISDPRAECVIIIIFARQITHVKTIIMAYVINEDCVACGSCIDECPVEAITEGDIYKIDPDICTDCGSCAEVCPTEAIHPAE